MNKKVLTLCTAMLLSGSSLVYASDYVNKWTWDWQTELSEFTTGKSVTLSEDGLTMTVNGDVEYSDQRNFLLIDKDNFVLDGNKHVWKGRIVITGENVTIKDLNIDYTNVMAYGGAGEDGTVIENKSAITVFAGSVNIENNTITVSSTSADDNHVANGITIYPTSATPKYNITDNKILNANEIAASDGTWPASPAFGIEIIGNISGGTDNGYTYFESKSGMPSFTITDFSGINLEGTTVKNSATDYAYIEASGKIPSETKDGDVYKVVEIEANENNAEAIKKALKNAADNATIKFDGTSEQLLAVLKDTEVTSNIAVQCAGNETNVVFGNPQKPANNWISETVAIDEDGNVATIQSVNWGEYTDIKAEGADTKVVLIHQGLAVKAFLDDNGESVYTLGEYRPSSTYEESLPAQYHFTLTPVEVAPKQYEVRLVDNYGHYFTVNDTYVTVGNLTVTEDAKGGLLYNGEELTEENAPIPTELELKAGNVFVTFSMTQSDFTTVANVYDAQAFGTAEISQAYMYAEDLLKRYAEYFTLDILYNNDDDPDYETDLTGIFEGELTPVRPVHYGKGQTRYELANPKDQSFMLMNENNQLLVLNKDPKTTWSSGTTIHAYRLDLISTKEYEADLLATDHAPYYEAYFSFEYTPGDDVATTKNITNIYVGGYKIGCYFDKQVPVLAGKGTASIDDVKIVLNTAGTVNAQSWLTSPSYYTVEVVNVNKKAQHYGKVLGLDESGDIDYVAPTKTDISLPEGQFAIQYVDDATDENGDLVAPYYTFTNRETGKMQFTMRASDLYTTGTANVFAYRDYRYNLMDTLKISPVSKYTSEDGFRRYSEADLNANTYNVSLRAIGGDVYVIENHDDKHRIGLDEENATDWRIEIPTVKVLDVTGDVDRYAADTVTVSTPIKYYVAGIGWVDTEMKKYLAPTDLKICTYILKNTATEEYISGDSDKEEAANSYYYCPSKTQATRFALKLASDSTVNLVPVYNISGKATYEVNHRTHSSINWVAGAEVREADYKAYMAESNMFLGGEKVIGGVSANKGILKDVALYSATSNDLFVISETGARTYKLLNQDDKIAISLMENNDEVIYEDGAFANIDNDQAYDINPTLYVDTAYINRPGNYRYDYLLSVRPLRVDSIESCNNPNHEHPRTTFTEGDFLVVMRDSMKAEADKNVHNNIYAYNEQPRLAFVPGIHQNDTLYYTNAAGEIIDKEEVGNAKYSFAKFAFKMINEANNEFVIETAYDYTPVKWVNGEPVEYEVSKGYLRWDNSFLVVTPNLDDAEHFTMEASELNATSNEEISAENSAVSVTATDGAVTIKGAEGKNVVIATILGKVVANEVINSDNETIAVPAGIAVVSVDGESFKVVVK